LAAGLRTGRLVGVAETAATVRSDRERAFEFAIAEGLQ
jgi:hypothetical protein